MERLIKKARKHCDQAEAYSLDLTTDHIIFQNGKLQNIDSQIQSGVSLRIIKDGKMGFAYTKNLTNRDALFNNTLNSLKGDVRVQFNLPKTQKVKKLNTYDPSIDNLSNSIIVNECKETTEYLKTHTDGQINITAGRGIAILRLLNSTGTDLKVNFSSYFMAVALLYPNSYAGIRQLILNKAFTKTPTDVLDTVHTMYNRTKRSVKVKGGPMKVLFLPEAMYVLMWRIQNGTNGRAIYEKQSPLIKKLGKKICDKKLTVENDPHDDSVPHARAFDDEGIPCTRFSIIKNGVLKHFYYDLDYAQRMEVAPTGHGFRSAQWGGETIALKPTPTLDHLHIKSGEESFEQLLGHMDRGVIVVNALGAHSGNIPNGDYSIGLSPGLYVEKGQIVGRIKDAMVAGNVYTTLQHIIAIENRVRPTMGGTFPAILFDDVNVATKS